MKLKDHEPVTVQLPSEHVVKLKRAALELQTFRHRRITTHADLIRAAVARFIEENVDRKAAAVESSERAAVQTSRKSTASPALKRSTSPAKAKPAKKAAKRKAVRR